MKKIARTAARPMFIVRVANPLVVDVTELLKKTSAYDGKVPGILLYDQVQEACVLVVKGMTADALCRNGVDWFDIAPCTKVLEENLKLVAKKMQEYAEGLTPRSPETTVKHIAACMIDRRSECLLRHVGLTA